MAALCAVLLATSCADAGCLPFGSKLDRLVEQLGGGCCRYSTLPTDAQPDSTCKPQFPVTGKLLYGAPYCVQWAANCLGEMGPEARSAVPALIAALRGGQNNFDTGDGVIPARDSIAVALGKTRDPRALAPLFEALANPKPIENSGSPKPAGEEAALEALGYLGEPALPEVPRIASYLSRPNRDPSERHVARAAAEALARLGDSRGVPPLVAVLEDPVRTAAAAYALREFGPRAAPAVPVLRRLIARDPDGENNFVLRSALFAIAGRDARGMVPNNYESEIEAINMFLNDLLRNHRVKTSRMHLNPPGNLIEVHVRGGPEVTLHFDRQRWIADRAVTGTIVAIMPGSETRSYTYATRGEAEAVLTRVLVAAPAAKP